MRRVHDFIRGSGATLALCTALLFVPACVPGPDARCEAGAVEPRCPATGESWFETTYEAVCGDAYTDCAAGVTVIPVGGRPSCDPDAPQLGPRCADGSHPYCYFADCRVSEEP